MYTNMYAYCKQLHSYTNMYTYFSYKKQAHKHVLKHVHLLQTSSQACVFTANEYAKVYDCWELGL